MRLRKKKQEEEERKKEAGGGAATWMDLEIIILSEVSQTEKEKYCMTSLLSGI